MGEREDPLTLKFTGIDNETTSEDDEEEEEDGNTDVTTHASNPIIDSPPTNSNYLTVNPTFGKINGDLPSIRFNAIDRSIGLENGSVAHQRNQSTSIPYKIYFDPRERPWSLIPFADVLVVKVAVSREHHFRLNPFL